MSEPVSPIDATGLRPRGLLSTTLIAAFLGAFAGFLWIGRGRLALVCLFVGAALVTFAAWRLYQGDVWTGWMAPAMADDLLATIGSAAVSLVLVLPFRKAARPDKWYSRGLGVASLLVASVTFSAMAALMFRCFLLQPFSIPSGSMRPTLMEGDHLFASKRAYGYGPYSLPFGPWRFLAQERIPPERGDIAIFRNPRNPSADYVMRVIGLPGDRIQMIAGVLHINGVAVRTEPVPPPPQTEGLVEPEATFYREFLPEGRSYVVENLVDGGVGDDTPVYVVPPGHYFMLGDNRDNSADSRFQTGMVPEENLVGRADVLFWNSEGVGFRDRRILAPATE